MGFVLSALDSSAQSGASGTPPAQKFCVLGAAFGQILGEQTPPQDNEHGIHQQVEYSAQKTAVGNSHKDAAQKTEDDVAYQQCHVELVASVATVHEAGKSTLDFVEEVSHGNDLVSNKI